jgi:superfamily II DNA or RNA helicase
VPNYQYHPLYKKKLWQGYIHLFSVKKRTLYAGLLHYVKKFCQEQGYELLLEGDFFDSNFSLIEAKEFITSLNLPESLTPRDYQIDAFVHCIRKRRALCISPTSSGKSLIMYLVTRYLNKPTLIVVSNTTLIHQLEGDFATYGYKEPIHKIYSGQEKDSGEKVTITTWQSVFKQPAAWFQKFHAIITDEAHHVKAKSLVELMCKTTTIAYKFGFTGSLDGSETSQIALEGLLGPLYKTTDTKTLMDRGFVSNLRIKSIILKHPEKNAKLLFDAQKKVKKQYQYAMEIDWLVAHSKRNMFIANLAYSLEGNTLILYRYVEKHGQLLYDILEEMSRYSSIHKGPVHFIHGKVDSEERNEIRSIVDNSKNSITIASQGTFSEGISIININNIIFASPSKSRILILQSLGRGMRKSEDKTECVVYDIADDLSTKKHKNYTLFHAAERLKYYIEERFDYQIYNVNL